MEPSMTASPERVRLAITAFGDSERFCSAVQALLDAGLEREQICVVARECGLARTCRQISSVRAADEPMPLAWLWHYTEPWRPFDGKDTIATSGPLLQLLRRLLEGDVASGGNDAVRVAQHLDFNAHLAYAVVVVVIRAAEPQQQLLTTRTLLTHSQHRVSTFEFSVAQADNRV
jgi:hypothetical protein